MPEQRYEITIGAPGSPVLSAFMGDRESDFSVIVGPLGSGKTTGVVQSIFARCCEQEPDEQGVRPTRVYCVRNTYPDLMGTTVKDFLEFWNGLGKFKAGGMERPEFKAEFDLEDGTRVSAEIIFVALDKLKDIRQIRGMQATFWWFNEVKELPKAVVDMALARVPRYPKLSRVPVTWSGAMGDSNAPDEDDWLYKEFWDNIHANPGWKLYLQPPAVFKTDRKDSIGRAVYEVNTECENYQYLQARYYEKMLVGKKESWIDVNMGNIPGFDEEGRPVQTGFHPDIHVVDEIEYRKDLPLLFGLDYGRTPAAIVGQYDPVMARLSCLWEMTSEGVSAEIFAPQLRREILRIHGDVENEGWGDPAGEDAGQAIDTSAAAIFRQKEIPVKRAPTNVFDIRVSAVDSLLTTLAVDGRPRLLISKQCRTLRKGLAGKYRYKLVGVSGEERFHEVPDKTSASHVCEALQYLACGVGEGKRIAKRPRRRTGPAVVDYEGYR